MMLGREFTFDRDDEKMSIHNTSVPQYANPFPDEQLILDGHVVKTSLPF